MPGHRIQLKGPWEFQQLTQFTAPADTIALETSHSSKVQSRSEAFEQTPGNSAHSSSDKAATVPTPLIPARDFQGKTKFPLLWQDMVGDFIGAIEVRRPFNCPTNLNQTDRVLLELQAALGIESVWLNGVRLTCLPTSDLPSTFDPATINRSVDSQPAELSAAGQSCQFDISKQLQPHNELRLRLVRTRDSTGQIGVWGTVCLVIDSAGH